ncbi:hypothetical protein CGRA01v4_03249 [Colletotrichum graminicola]|uniref:14-3-3 domain-containing protein n=1 Tax=Colletotrichum graminicola (strain M1.001 / M2 / FGSC 10212) TaxID=645133 RepID=E3QB15_COLGM|nr:uncharacterized protein GLRG_03197 [Colletotrichum graminicola M1.001]EFQ28053.1 hypothetical protein GLRG_03197 [Colletotrichum graminicola M1.001]WDK11970.1 hypothetical protein CGRA01v4_03249 [Colletotrichum graminicola]
MASSEVDQKFLGKWAKTVENDNPLLSSMLYKILGLSLSLAEKLVTAKKQRRPDVARTPQSADLILHIIWLSREGLVMLQQYVIPMVGNHTELRVLAYKLRASFYHIFVLFHNKPAVSTMGIATPDTMAGLTPPRLDKGKGIAREEWNASQGSIQPTHALEGGPVNPPPGFPPQSNSDFPAAFLEPPRDYLPDAQKYFKEAIALADQHLWGSHSLRLSVKTEYAAFLYDCVHDTDGSRKLAKDTISEVYGASEGMDDDMFADACELVTVLGKMMKRGLGSSNNTLTKGSSPSPAAPPGTTMAPGMENPI